MFHNGRIKDNFNFKTICSLKEKEKTTRISYENGYYIYVYQDNTLEMEERRETSIKQALQKVGGHSRVCHPWEIYKLLFLMHNVKPVWIEVDNIMDENFDKVFINYVSSNLNIVILVY